MILSSHGSPKETPQLVINPHKVPITSLSLSLETLGGTGEESKAKTEMEIKKNGGDDATQSYEDFEPFCNWIHDEKYETLVLHLPGTTHH